MHILSFGIIVKGSIAQYQLDQEYNCEEKCLCRTAATAIEVCHGINFLVPSFNSYEVGEEVDKKAERRSGSTSYMEPY